MTYTVAVLRESDGRYSVSVPALKGCHTWGDTLPEALSHAQGAKPLRRKIYADREVM
jgi:predicted RNase H-like HicB family nuclease